MSRETSNLGLILYDPSEDKDVKVRDVINKVLGFTDSNTIKIDAKTKDIDTNIKTLHDSIIGTDGNVVFYNKQEVFLAVHPVGSIFLSTSDIEPAGLYGGTWERIEERFIMGASDTYPAGSTGGSATHSQTAREVARHCHGIGNNYEGTILTVPQWSFYVTSTLQVFDQEGYECYGMSTLDVGDGAPMDILNPYYSAYIWRRVA